jgi:transposase
LTIGHENFIILLETDRLEKWESVMKDDWLLDGRKIPDQAMYYIRKLAVHAIRDNGFSPELIADVFDFSRSAIYDWLESYDKGGYLALESRQAPGAEPVINVLMDAWLKKTVLNSTPVDHGYDTVLWTRDILTELLNKEFGVSVSPVTVGVHLKKMGLTYQKPDYRDEQAKDSDIEFFINEKFPRIQRLADKIGADFGFEDEAGIGVMTRSGKTWGVAGHHPEIPVSMERHGYNMLSIVTPEGIMQYNIVDGKINSDKYIEFLGQIIENRQRPLILMTDHAKFHKSEKVRHFVRANRSKIRVFFLPKRSPKFNPDEQVWNEIKNNKIGKQPIKNKIDLRKRLDSELKSLQENTDRVKSFFNLPDTKYALA